MEQPAGADMQVAETIEAPPPSPFARLRVRGLAGLSVLFALLALVLLALFASPAHRTPDERVLVIVLTAAMGLPVIVRARETGLRWRRVFGSRLQTGDLPLTAAVVPVALLTMASALLLYVPLSYVAPDFVRRLLLDDSLFDATTVKQWLLLALGAAVIAPIMEEVVFRGIVMQRWAYRWGTRRGVIASSALFALLHGEWLGHFLFGILMSLLYLRTRRLWVPIVAHGINNLVLSLPVLWRIVAHLPPDPPETLASFRAEAWLGAPALAAGLLLLWFYLRRYWPDGSVRAALEGPVPYEVGEPTPPYAASVTAPPLSTSTS
jgi:membrane protease YdiL (CAAX protease family)